MKRSDNQLDNLFRDKFEKLEVMPEHTSWDKLAFQLKQRRKSHFRVWYGVAAAIVLLIVGSIYFVPLKDVAFQQVDNHLEIVNDAMPKTNEGTVSNTDEPVDISDNAKERVKKKAEPQQARAQNTGIQMKVNSHPKQEIGKESMHIPLEVLDAKPIMVRAIQSLPGGKFTLGLASKKDMVILESTGSETLPDVKIVYKKDKEETAQKGGMQKVLDLAKEVKEMNLLGFGRLREAKNELIARNINKVNNKNGSVIRQENDK